jgi:hypothetical protein
MKTAVVSIGIALIWTIPALACSPQPWSADPCRRADLPSCYYDWTTAGGDRLGTCTSVLNRCEGEFTDILNMCKKGDCSKDLVAYATKNLQMTERAYGTVCAHTGLNHTPD